MSDAEIQACLAFAREDLLPCAISLLRERYAVYSAGGDIGVETKSDASPATRADRDTEEALRGLIAKRWPEHGVWGEEYGADGTDREWVWVLDPLDGTQEFLARKEDGFGTLIALLRGGVPVLGIIGDPMGGAHTSAGRAEAVAPRAGPPTLKDAALSCTNPDGMFPDPAQRAGMQAMQARARRFSAGLNCMGFAQLCRGDMDLAVESKLKLHDIAALLPVLRAAGCTTIDLEGRPYDDQILDPAAAPDARYGLIAAVSAELATEALEILHTTGEKTP